MSVRVILIAVVCMTALVAAAVLATTGPDRQSAGPFDTTALHDQPVHVDVQFETDFSDPRRVAGYADDVFFGKVLSKTGTARGPTEGDDRLRTTYDVRVLDRLKGTVADIVSVSQLGGVDDQGRIILFEGDPLLSVDGIYLLATFNNGGERLALARFGTLPVPGEDEYRQLKPRFDDAVRNQIKPEPEAE